MLPAVRQLIRSERIRKLLDEAAVSNAMYSAGIPDPDLIIRPEEKNGHQIFYCGSRHIQNIILPILLWPDMNEKALEAALVVYQRRKRRFGDWGQRTMLTRIITAVVGLALAYVVIYVLPVGFAMLYFAFFVYRGI